MRDRADPARGAERAHDLRDLFGLAGTGSAKLLGDGADQRGLGPVGELDLELAKASREPRAVQHRDLVVDQLGELRAAAITHHHAVANGVEPSRQRQRLAADQRVHHVDRGLGGIARFPAEMQLRADEHEVGGDLVLDRPPFIVSVAEARAGTGQAQVGGVEVRGLETQRLCRLDGDVGTDDLEIGHSERRPRCELQLAFLHRCRGLRHRVGVRTRGPA